MATQVSLNSGAVASAGALAIQTNGTTQAVSISTGQVATLAQNPILTSGTANGVAYLNGSKVLTTGSALVFDGTNLGVGTTLSTSDGTLTFQQIGQTAIFAGQPSAEAMWIGSNYYYDGGWKYKTTNSASQFYTSGGAFYWKNITSGSANAGITWNSPMTLDASGNLGVGVTTVGAKLHVLGASQSAIFASTSANLNYIEFKYNSNTTYGTIGNGGILTPTGNTSDFVVRSEAELAFATGGATERARIDSSGNLLVGTTSGSTNVIQKSNASSTVLSIINSSATSPSGGVFNFSAAAPNNGTQTFWTASDNAAYRGGFLSNGGLQNYQSNDSNLSDRREKTNFAPAKSYLDVICAIPVQTFNYIDQNMEDDGGLTLGVVAQDVQAVAPELVMESNWASKDDEPKMRLSIYQTDLQYALMKCIQEQQSLITQLTARITALEGA
jgi:hypothetical protein